MEELSPNSAPAKIKNGDIIIAITAAGWSLLCHAGNTQALEILREIKSRSLEKGFTILVESDARLNLHAVDVPSLAWDIIDTSDEPITLVMPRGKGVAKEALAADGSIAIRMVKEKSEIDLVRLVNGPVACTALLDSEGNPVKYPEEAPESVLSKVDYLIDLPLAKSSTKKTPIVRLGMDGEVKIIRS